MDSSGKIVDSIVQLRVAVQKLQHADKQLASHTFVTNAIVPKLQSLKQRSFISTESSIKLASDNAETCLLKDFEASDEEVEKRIRDLSEAEKKLKSKIRRQSEALGPIYEQRGASLKAEYTNYLNELRKELADCEEAYQQKLLEKEKTDSAAEQRRYAAQHAERERSKGEVQELKDHEILLKKQVERLKEEYEREEQEVLALEKEIANKSGNLSLKPSRVEALETKVRELETETEALSTALKELEVESFKASTRKVSSVKHESSVSLEAELAEMESRSQHETKELQEIQIRLKTLIRVLSPSAAVGSAALSLFQHFMPIHEQKALSIQQLYEGADDRDSAQTALKELVNMGVLHCSENGYAMIAIGIQ